MAKKTTKRRATRTMFMHTLDGLPASYDPGCQIHFASHGRYARKGIRLATSIAEIRAQREASNAWRDKQGFEPTDESRFGYVRVEVPTHV